MEAIILEKSNSSIKKPMHLKKNIFIKYCPTAAKIEPTTSIKIDTEVVEFLPQNAKGFIISIF